VDAGFDDVRHNVSDDDSGAGRLSSALVAAFAIAPRRTILESVCSDVDTRWQASVFSTSPLMTASSSATTKQVDRRHQPQKARPVADRRESCLQDAGARREL
jgi:hypothetical protein